MNISAVLTATLEKYFLWGTLAGAYIGAMLSLDLSIWAILV